MYPILVQFGPIGLRTLPVVWAVGIYAGVKLAAAELRRRRLDPAWAHDLLTSAVIAGLVGARLFLGVPVHPTQLYEALALLVLFAGLWMARRARCEGTLFLLYLSGLVALAPLDLLKGDALWVADIVPVALVASLAALLGAGAARARRPRPAAAGAILPVETPDLRTASSKSSR